jgi:SnoaL-like protein
MSDAERRTLIERSLAQVGGDNDIAHEMYHHDAVLDFPQSGERFDGLENFKEWRSQYPAHLEFEVRSLRGDGDVWVAESAIRYGGGASQPGVSILEFRGDKVARETIYVTEPWEAAEWRARWRSAP